MKPWEEKYEEVRGDESLEYGSMMGESISNFSKNVLKNPTLGGVTGALVGEGATNLGKIINRGGYKAGGMVTDTLAPHVPAEVAGAAGYATNVGVQALPSLAGTGIAKKTIEPLMQYGGKKLMQSALKPGKSDILSGDATKMVDTLLNRWINVTPAGAAKLQTVKDGLISKVNDMIEGLPKGASVNKYDVADEVLTTIDKFKKQVNSSKDIKTIKKAWDEFNKNFPANIPIKQAQEAKIGTYARLGEKAYTGELKSSAIEAQQALARGLKKGVEKNAPQIGKTNKELGDVMSALRQLEYRIPMAANRDIAGLAPLAANPGAAGLHMADRSPLIKSGLSQLLYHGAKPVATGIGSGTGMLLNYSGLLGDR